MDVAHLDKLLQIVRDVGAEIIAAGAQLTGCQFGIADIEQKKSLHRIDVGTSGAVELVLDYVEKPAMKALNKRKSLHVQRLELNLGRLSGDDRSRLYITPSIDHLTASLVVRRVNYPCR
jgi:hypothetical protein